MKKILIGVAIILAVGGYFWWSMKGTTVPPTTSTTSIPSETTNPTATIPPTIIPPVVSGYKDGTYTGAVADSIYGAVQVRVTITGGKIVTVNVPKYPNDGGNNTKVSNMSIPVLKQETIAAQSAQVDIVSEATQTSEAFQQSLASALSQAS